MARREKNRYRNDVLATLPGFGSDIDEPVNPLPTIGNSPDDEHDAQVAWSENRAPYQCMFIVQALDGVDAALVPLGADRIAIADTLPELTQSLRTTTNEIEKIDREFGAAISARRKAEDRLRLEFSRIAENPKVSHLEISTDRLTVITKPLVITAVEGSRWDVGSWEIQIPRMGSYLDIRCKSRRREVRHDTSLWIHPHVNGDGVICWGNGAEAGNVAFRNADFDIVVALVIAILDSGRDYHMNLADGQRGGGHSYEKRLKEIADQIA